MLATVGASERRRQWAFLTWLPFSSYVSFLAAVFFTFLPIAFLIDISDLGTHPPMRLAGELLFAGAIAVAYVLAVRQPKLLPVVVAAHVIIAFQSGRAGTGRGRDAARPRWARV